MNNRSASAHNACEQIIGWQAAEGLANQPAILAGERRLTFAELTKLVNRIGNAFLANGIKRGDRVLILLRDTPELVATWLAVIKIGAIAVALNTRSSPKDIAYAIDDSTCSALVLEPEFHGLHAAGRALAEHAPSLVVNDVNSFAERASDILTAEPVLPGDPAFCIYTSGTTGSPKAALHRHGGVSIGHLHLKESMGLVPGERVFSTSKLFFAFALGHCMVGALKCGATVILHDGWPDAEAVAQVVERHRPDLFLSVPTMYRNLLRSDAVASASFRRIRHFISAGERLPEQVFDEWQRATGQPILEGIGTSETVFLAIANTPLAYRKGVSGRVLPWAKAELVAEDGSIARGPGASGVLRVKMESVAAGYWNQPLKTAEAFSNGWYRTGDVFTVDAEGWWRHEGRADDMLKISGQWVSPAEIEEHAMKVPGVAEVAAVGVPNDDGLVRLGLVVVAGPESPEAKRLEEALRQHFERNLSIYKCPRRIRFVDEMPRTVTGKLQRYKVREMFAAGE
ncbi:MAG: AMP-binding protein [Solirubrobacterales bacterium]